LKSLDVDQWKKWMARISPSVPITRDGMAVGILLGVGRINFSAKSGTVEAPALAPAPLNH